MAFTLQSLVQILEQDQHRHHLSFQTKSEINSFLEKAHSLRNLIETTSFEIIEDLKSRIRDASHMAEDLIESYISYQLVPEEDQDECIFELNLADVMAEFDSIQEEIMRKMVDSGSTQVDIPLTESPPDISSSRMWDRIIYQVGFRRDFTRLKNQLVGPKSQLQVIPIVGIGGSGKTTLVQALYKHSSIISYVDTHAWVTISQEFDLRSTLLVLLRSLLYFTNTVLQESDESLGECLRRSLLNMRYLIVVDDIWHTNVWDTLKRFFPDNKNGSRIILTTREWNVAEYAKTSVYPHQMLPISDDSSWYILCQKVFGDEPCPPELVEIGRKIAVNCKGHPQALVTIGGFLSMSGKTLDDWKHIESHQLDSRDTSGEVDSLEKEKIQVAPSLKGFVEFFAKDGLQLMQKLMQGQSELMIVPIVGVGESTGKTILARLLYDRALCGQHFDTNAWVKIKGTETMGTKQRNVLATLQDLLDSLNKCGMSQVNDDDIGVRLHKTLKNRRYLIVIDDIRDAYTWDTIRRFCPNEGNGSRIILSAREWSHIDGINPFYLDSYWEFLLGKITRLLITTEKKLEFWKLVEDHVNSVESNRDLNLDLLSMSYNHLPHHLKPCFLYVAVFPEDYEIQATKIIQIWIAEGFIRSSAHHSLEDTARIYLDALVDRNLIFVSKNDFDGTIVGFKVHDILWKFCQKKALEEKFLWHKDLEGCNIPEDGAMMHRVSVHPMSRPCDDEEEVMSFARTFMCTSPASLDLVPMFLFLRFLRVLDVLQLHFDEFPEELLKLINLRYMALSCCSNLPSSISIFRNLQTLITSNILSLPSELWEMTQLRHIESMEPCSWNILGKGESSHHEELQTLINIPASEVTYKFLRHNPNLRNLEIIISASTNDFLHLDCLNKLESLKCFSFLSKRRHDFLPYLRLPASLRKLTLSSCMIDSKDMDTNVGLLPVLENLCLQNCDFVNVLWEPAEGGFPRLRYLLMENLNLVHWYANNTHFPDLQRVDIHACYAMEELPSDIGHISTLRLIKVDENCSPSILNSAKRIRKKQIDLGNDLFLVFVTNGAEYCQPSLATDIAEYSSRTSVSELAMEKPENLSGEELCHIEHPNSTVIMAEEAEAKGYTAFSTGNIADAIKHYTEAINLHPWDHFLYSNRSEAHASLKQYPEALSDALNAVQLKPNWSEAYSRLGFAYLRLENYTEAISAYKKGIEFDSNDNTLKSGLSQAKAVVALGANNFHDAILHFTNAVSLYPSHHFLYANRSFAYASLKQYPKALSDAFKVLQLKPDYIEGYSCLGAAYLGLHNYKGAVSAYEKSLEIDPNNDYLKSRLSNAKANVAYSVDNFDDTIQHFTDAISFFPSDHTLYLNRSAIYSYVFRYSEALSDAQKCVQLKPDFSNGYSRLGAAYLGVENYKGAVFAFEKGLEIDPNNDYIKSRFSNAKGNAALDDNNFVDAIRHFTDAINVSPMDHILYFNRSNAYVSLNQFSDVLLDAQKMVQLSPGWKRGYSRLGDAHLNLKNYKDAIFAYKNALQIDPGDENLEAGLSKAKAALAKHEPAMNDVNPYVNMFESILNSIKMKAKLLILKRWRTILLTYFVFNFLYAIFRS